MRLSRKTVIGGIDEEGTLRHGSWEDLKQEMERAKEQSNGRRWMLAPGCAIPVDVPEAHLRMVREEVERW